MITKPHDPPCAENDAIISCVRHVSPHRRFSRPYGSPSTSRIRVHSYPHSIVLQTYSNRPPVVTQLPSNFHPIVLQSPSNPSPSSLHPLSTLSLTLESERNRRGIGEASEQG